MYPNFITTAPNAKNITGQRFGRLFALGPIERRGKLIIWLCQCDCGKTATVATADLRNGHTRSCGCLVSDFNIQRNTSHGLAHDPLYPVWRDIIRRCTNPKRKAFADYGGRGIRICDEWRHDFQAFHDCVTKLPHYGEKDYTLDRIDNDGNYEPGNMRWATWSEQARNRRNNRMILFDGKTQSMAAWSEETKISHSTLAHRLDSGWSTERAFSSPITRGEDSPLAKLTEADVLEIRALAASGIPRKDIARQFSINPATVTRIVLRQRWQHI